MNFRYKHSGWYNESWRHSLAAKGIKTSYAEMQPLFKQPEVEPEVPGVTLTQKQFQDLLSKGKQTTRFRGETKGALEKFKEVEKISKEIVKTPIQDAIERTRAGVFEDMDLYAKVGADDKMKFSQAAYEGAENLIQMGRPVPYDTLKLMGVSDLKAKDLKRLESFTKRGGKPSVAQKAWGITKEIGTQAEAGAEKVISTGTKRMLEPEGEPVKWNGIVPEISHEDELAKDKGALNFFKITGLEQASQAKPRTKDDRIIELAEANADDIYTNRHSIAKVDMSSYDKGESAYRKGDRESLMDAIHDLQAEFRKVKDRIELMQKARSVVKSDINALGSSKGAKVDDNKMMPNPVLNGFGRGGWDKLVKQTNKISRSISEAQKSSDKVSSRINVLKMKLSRLEKETKLPLEAHEETRYFDQDGSSWNFAKGSLKAVDNPTMGENPFLQRE